MVTEGSIRDSDGARVVVEGLSNLVLRTIERATADFAAERADEADGATDNAAGAEGGAEAAGAAGAAGADRADRAAATAEAERAAEGAEDSAATEADGPAARGSAGARREESAYGGAGDDREPTQSERDMLGELKADVERVSNAEYQVFNPILVRTSVAAGTNYTFTVRVVGHSGEGKLAVTVFEPLPSTNAPPRVTDVITLSPSGADAPADAPGAEPVYVEVDAGSLDATSGKTFMESWAASRGIPGIPPVWAYESAYNNPYEKQRTTYVKFRYTGDANTEAAAKDKEALEERSARGDFRNPLSSLSLFPPLPRGGVGP